MKYHKILEDFYQKVIKGELTKQEAASKLKNLIESNVRELISRSNKVLRDGSIIDQTDYSIVREEIGYIPLRKEIISTAEKGSIITELAANYISEGVVEEEAKVLAKLELILATRAPFEKWPPEAFCIENRGRIYSLDGNGHIFKLGIDGLETNELGYFPEEICLLRELEDLYITRDCISKIPTCISEPKKLKRLDLSFNEIEKIPIALKQLDNLEHLSLMDFSQLDKRYPPIYYENVLDYINLDDYNEDINVKDVHALMDEKSVFLWRERR